MNKNNNIKEEIAKNLNKKGIKHEFISLPDDMSLDTASHIEFHGIKLEESVPTLICNTEKGFVAIQKRSDTQVNLKKLKSLIGIKRLEFASTDDLKRLGVEPGIVPLVGMDLPYYTDKSVLEIKGVYGGSGSKKFTLKINPYDLVKANQAVVGDFADLKGNPGPEQKRILTGDNTTGKLHLGHYVGSLENRVKLQDEYDTFIILADMHSFAYPKYIEKPEVVHESVREVLLDNIAVGLDPKKVTFFPESQVPEIYELAIIFSMLVSHNRALRNPTLKEEIRDKKLGDSYSLGFINFPILQVADILSVKAGFVPVGEDQLPHLELTNEVVRRFNQLYKGELKEIKGLVGRVRRLIGTDGNTKMTKSLDNTIYLSDSAEEVERKVMSMYTDPTRIHSDDPGHLKGNPVFIYLDAFGKEKDRAQIEEFKKKYKAGTVGDIEVKKYLIKVLNNFLEPIRKRRAEYESQPELVEQILKEGAQKVRKEAQKTLEDVRQAMKID